jgi:hypothetical protein
LWNGAIDSRKITQQFIRSPPHFDRPQAVPIPQLAQSTLFARITKATFGSVVPLKNISADLKLMMELKPFKPLYLIGWVIISILLTLVTGSLDPMAFVTITFGFCCIGLVSFGLSHLGKKPAMQREIIWWIYPAVGTWFVLKTGFIWFMKFAWMIRPFPKNPNDPY